MTTGNLPNIFVDKYRNMFGNVQFFGISITQLGRDELMAIICVLGQGQRAKDKQCQYEIDFWADLCTANRLKNRSLVAQLLQRCREIRGSQKEK